MAAFFFASPIDVDVKLEGEEVRKQVDMKQEKERSISCPVYYDGDSIGGQVRRYDHWIYQPFADIFMLAGCDSCSGWEEVDSRRDQGGICRQHRCVVLTSHHYSFDSHYTELFYDRGHHHEFLSLSQELAAPGEMRQAQTFDFLFKNVEKQFESYQGINVKLRFDSIYGLFK
jgi:vacuolar protein sorting-associated protein 26